MNRFRFAEQAALAVGLVLFIGAVGLISVGAWMLIAWGTK